MLRYYKKSKNVKTAKTYVLFIASNGQNIMITIERIDQK